MKLASLWEPIPEGYVKCKLCKRGCVVPEGGRGFCRARLNSGGKLYTLTYGNISALESRPIEIKPFYHYWPGSTSMTYSSWSCNLDCIWCQNHHLSKADPELRGSVRLTPEEVVRKALEAGDEGVCCSFNEPTLLHEFNVECFRLAQVRGLYSCYVSNGYLSKEALEELAASGMDAINIDVKGDDEVYKEFCRGVSSKLVWKTAREALELGMHVEVVCLIVTNVNDSERDLKWLVKNHLRYVSSEVPIHFNRYFPAYKFSNLPTPPQTLLRAREIAVEAGIDFAYVGNVCNPYENTYCPSCDRVVLERRAGCLLSAHLKDGKCKSCGHEIPIVGRVIS